MTKKEGFIPMRLQAAPLAGPDSPSRVTATCTLKGSIADEFESIRDKYGLNRSQLVMQMIYHCLGKSDELKDFYRRLAILGD